MSLSQVIRRARDACPSWHAGLVAALLLGFCGLAGTMLLQLRTQAWNQAKVDANNTVATLSRDIDRNVELYDLSLQAVIRGLQLPDLPLLRPAVRQAVLFDGAAAAQYLGAILVLDEHGTVVEDSGAMPPRRANLPESDFFQVHESRADVGLFVSRPFRSRVTAPGDLVIALSRRLNHPDGSFAGVVAGTMRLAYFCDLFAQLHLDPHASLALLRRDGVLLMRAPFEAAQIGRDFSDTGNVQRFMATRSGSFTGTASLDGVRRLYTFTWVGDLPLMLDVALSEEDVLAAWRDRAAVIGAALLALCAMTAALATLFARELRRSAQARRELELAHAEVSRLANLDALTGLPNRRCLDAHLERAWCRAAHAGTILSVLLLDVDRFKLFNDCYGHQQGDACLRAVAEAVSAAVRHPDGLVARYGGEELMVVLPDLGTAGALAVAERVRASIEALHVPHEDNDVLGGVVTASLGAASLSPDAAHGGAGPRMLVEAADRALYEAKRRGRNRVVSAEGLERQVRHPAPLGI